MNKDLELSNLRAEVKRFEDALNTIRQDAHALWGTTGAQHALKRIERQAAHVLDYRENIGRKYGPQTGG